MGIYDEEILKIRTEIDKTDKNLIDLLVKRLNLSASVAETKRKHGMPVFDASREKLILEKVKEKAGDNGDFVSAVYASILSSSRAKQHMMLADGKEIRTLFKNSHKTLPNSGIKVICQGVLGAYTHMAAAKFFDDDCITFSGTWDEVFKAVADKKADFGVLPIENSAAGSVSDVYDLILKYRFYIVGATEVRVRHCLAAKKGATQIRTVISHAQGLSQCSDFISQYELKSQTFSNTATAAKFVSEQSDVSVAAICSEEAANEYGLEILQEGIQNTNNNTTRFIVISREAYFPHDADKISLCFSLPHTAGTLSSVLSQFSMQELNLTKIESRPIPEKKFEYDFYLDFSGNIHDANALNLICTLHDEMPRFSFLGNYKEIED